MEKAEWFLLDLMENSRNINLETHKILASSPYIKVRRAWASSANKPHELVTERLKTEDDTYTLRQLISNLEPEVVTILATRGRADVILEEIFTCFSRYEEEEIVQALKLARDLNSEAYVRAAGNEAGKDSGLWYSNNDSIMEMIIPHVPAESLTDLAWNLPGGNWDSLTSAFFNKVTTVTCEETLEALSVAATRPFGSLTKTAQKSVEEMLGNPTPEKLSQKQEETLKALKWWAGMGPAPAHNELVDEIKLCHNAPEDLPVWLPADADVEEAKAFVQATQLKTAPAVNAFSQWLGMHKRTLDPELILAWLTKFDKNAGMLDRLVGAADDLGKLRALSPAWLKGNTGLFLKHAQSIGEVENFPLENVLADYKNSAELLEYIKSFDKSLEIFYTLSNTYEGTLAEFLEVIKEFKAENA